jgi:4-hydroxy-2-oxoheptanedioate aldolase
MEGVKRVERRLVELLAGGTPRYGVICRDATQTDLELIAGAGFSSIWMDLEHGGPPLADALALCRFARSLGLIALLRVPELTRAFVQPALDAGIDGIVVPDVRDVATARELVRLGRFPPVGDRGGSSATAWSGYAAGADIPRLAAGAGASVHLAVQIESDEGYRSLEEILAVPGIDMVTVGPLDWRLRGDRGDDPAVSDKVERVMSLAAAAGKVAAIPASTPAEARRYVASGAHLVFVGIDIGLKRDMYRAALARFREAG